MRSVAPGLPTASAYKPPHLSKKRNEWLTRLFGRHMLYSSQSIRFWYDYAQLAFVSFPLVPTAYEPFFGQQAPSSEHGEHNRNFKICMDGYPHSYTYLHKCFDRGSRGPWKLRVLQPSLSINLPCRLKAAAGSTLLDQLHFGRSGALWPIRSALADRVHFGRSGPLWPTRSTLADRVRSVQRGPLWPIMSTLADQVRVGRSGPLWPIKSTLADAIKVHFG